MAHQKRSDRASSAASSCLHGCGWGPCGFPYGAEKASRLLKRPFCSHHGAEGESNPTGFPASPSRWRVLTEHPFDRRHNVLRTAHKDDLRSRRIRVDDVENAIKPDRGLFGRREIHGILSVDVAADG